MQITISDFWGFTFAGVHAVIRAPSRALQDIGEAKVILAVPQYDSRYTRVILIGFIRILCSGISMHSSSSKLLVFQGKGMPDEIR